MLEKLSVRKPFTVLVGVILVIVLGVVSFVNTSTDLLPSMNLPYAAILTTYPGMTPEQVEADVTAPIEGRMGTVGGIDRIMSISNEHVSIVILRFTESTNMDSASIEIREALDMARLPESAGRPTILKLNPDMLPIMVAAVHMEGMTVHEISALTLSELAPALEGVVGVASANASGMIQHQIHVVLRDEKIKKVNANIQEAVQKQIDELREEMTQIAEEEITERVQEYAQTRTAELISSGMSAELASAQVQAELPAVTEQIAQAVTEAMSEGAEEQQTPDVNSIGIPADMLTVDTITNILSAQNFSMPAGIMTEDEIEYMVRVGDRFTDADEIASIMLFNTGIEGLSPILLSDVADVFHTDNSDARYTRLDGTPAVMIIMQKQSEFSTSDVARDLLARFDELSEKYEGLGFTVLMDQGEMIGRTINSVLNNLIIGGLLAIIILLLFLRDLRPTLIVAVSIPISLMLAFTAMYFTGVSLNIISMSGLALGVGMLVDNSIVVIENIYRLRSLGAPAKRAAVEGAKQVAGAIAASTLTTISVFLPIVFTEGMTRQLFTDLALTIAFSLLASLLVALTVVPAASSGMFRNVKEKEHKLWGRFRDWYANLLGFTLRYKWATLLIAVILFGVSLWGIGQKGMEFLPQTESAQMMITATLPEGVAFEEAVAIAEILSERVGNIDDIETVGVTMSSGEGGILGASGIGGGSGGTGITMYVLLKDNPQMTNDQISNLIRAQSEDLNCEVSTSGGMSGGLLGMAGDGISIRVQGNELDNIRDTAVEIAEIVRSVEGTANISDGSQAAAPELRVRVDKDKAMQNGLTVAQVFMAVNHSLTDPEKTITMDLSGAGYEIVVMDGQWSKPGRAGLERLEITNNSGEVVILSNVAEVYEDTGFISINRMNGSRYVTVSGEIADGFNVGLVSAEIERRLGDYTPREGCTISIGGEAESILLAFNDLYLMLALALVFIYLIMVAQFQSLLSPFIVMFAIPLAFTGGFAALIIADMPLSVVSMIGLILLTGVVVNNGIVYVDCVNQQRKEGASKKDALVEAGRIRVRPILMTALTTIFAMSTMMLGIGSGIELVQPMAVASVGGLLYATLMTLFVVPSMYDLFHRDRDMRSDEIIDNEIAINAGSDSFKQ